LGPILRGVYIICSRLKKELAAAQEMETELQEQVDSLTEEASGDFDEEAPETPVLRHKYAYSSFRPVPQARRPIKRQLMPQRLYTASEIRGRRRTVPRQRPVVYAADVRQPYQEVTGSFNYIFTTCLSVRFRGT
jgi:hypothetical protein